MAKAKRKPSNERKCEVCGQMVKARGYKSHLRLAHKLVLDVKTRVIEVTTQVDSSNKLFPDSSKPSQVQKTTQVIEQVTDLRKVVTAGLGGKVVRDVDYESAVQKKVWDDYLASGKKHSVIPKEFHHLFYWRQGVATAMVPLDEPGRSVGHTGFVKAIADQYNIQVSKRKKNG